MSFSVGDRVRCKGGDHVGTIRFISQNSATDILFEVKFDEDIIVDLGGDEEAFAVPHISFRSESQIEKVTNEAPKVSSRYKSKVED
jgi:hypothetical protein